MFRGAAPHDPALCCREMGMRDTDESMVVVVVVVVRVCVGGVNLFSAS